MEADEGTTEIKTETTLENQDLSFLHQYVGVYVADYGWILLLLCMGVYLLIEHLSKRISRHEAQSSSLADEDTLAVVRRQEALEASRRRMQEALDAKAVEFKEKQQEMEEEKRNQKLEMWDSMQQGKSYKGNAKSLGSTGEASTSTMVKPKSNKKPLRSSGYNPLTGEGGGACAFRPGRRGPSGGG
ncbi:hypothetical protein COCON_G00216660 [Conger conger]|uniref:Selenoprotein S n=1 Tax=Conger conger TaxID=82655 RepID=A0A9Q1CYQ0_CONCO|nr:selenoprotein S [Conger conger]KAJ8252354.1 hypothetical protein COCON_G00216660 [Conger conger]